MNNDVYTEVEELELEVVTPGIEGLCATIIVEPKILEEIKLWQMEDSKLKIIYDSLETKQMRNSK